MKILQKKYPKGSLPRQQSAGRYVDGYLYNNLKILAESIVKDMTFLGIGFSSTLEVGTGKSVLFTQIGEIWTQLMKEIHNIDVPFTQKNIVWRPKDLIQRSFEVPKYSCILVDEWEDAHYWSELGMTLRQFFRKCRQLNLFILVIIPNFFQLPMNYALGRSVFAIDIRFSQNFERGFFSFYDFERKKDLYILGKRTHNYHVKKPSFFGRFVDGYGIPREDYVKAKAHDLENIEADETVKINPKTIEFNSKIIAVRKVFMNKKMFAKDGINIKSLAHVFGISDRTMSEWILEAKRRNEKFEKFLTSADSGTFIKKLTSDGVVTNDEKTEKVEVID